MAMIVKVQRENSETLNFSIAKFMNSQVKETLYLFSNRTFTVLTL